MNESLCLNRSDSCICHLSSYMSQTSTGPMYHRPGLCYFTKALGRKIKNCCSLQKARNHLYTSKSMSSIGLKHLQMHGCHICSWGFCTALSEHQSDLPQCSPESENEKGTLTALMHTQKLSFMELFKYIMNVKRGV